MNWRVEAPDLRAMLDIKTDYSAESLRTRILTASVSWHSEVDGDYTLNPGLKSEIIENAIKEAAVLIGFVERSSIFV